MFQSGDVLQIAGRSFDKTILARRNRLKDKIEQKGFLVITEEVAYTWFNRFCAIRYMELNDDFFEHGIRILPMCQDTCHLYLLKNRKQEDFQN